MTTSGLRCVYLGLITVALFLPGCLEPKPPKKQSENIIGKTTDEVIDLRKAMAANPALVPKGKEALGHDPVTQSTNAYVYVRAQVSTLGMQQQVQAHKALNDHYPTYEEFMGYMKQYNIHFTALKPWESYAYDSETGDILVVRDMAEKERIYKENGLETE